MEPIRLAGQVLVPPTTDERRVLVMTDIGELRIFEAPLDGSGLRQIAARGATNENVGLMFPLLDRSDVWIADTRFSRFELQATRGQLIQKWTRNNDDRFVGPLRRDGDLLFHIRRRAGMLGATVSATMIQGGRQDGVPVWETDVGVPCDVLVDAQGGVQAMTANGALFPIDGTAVERGITNRRAARVDPRLLPKALVQQLRMSDNEVVFASSPPLSQYIQANLAERELRYVPLRLGSDQATTELVRFGDALVVACDAGQLELVDANTGKARMTPFLPRVEPGSRIAWLKPAPIGEQLVAAEKSGRVYRLAPTADNAMLQMVAQNTFDVEFTKGLAAVGTAVYGVVRDTDGIELVTVIDPGQLTLGAQTPVTKGVTWGPERVGESVIVVDAAGATYCFDDQGALRWKLDEQVGPLAGRPLVVDETIIFTSSRGMVWVVDAAGQVRAKLEVAEPLGSGPVKLGSRLLLAGWDGTLYVVNVPQ
jgi:outer membrane protein assembly factor BamB